MTRLLTHVVPLLTLLAVTLASAPAEATEKRLIRGVFLSETGARTDFTATEGRALLVQNSKTGVKYRVVPEVLGQDRIVFKVQEATLPAAEARQLDAVEVQVNGQARRGAVVPFSLMVTGLESRSASPAASPAPSQLNVEGGGSSCCISCGDWNVCCEPGSGWCCELSNTCNKYCWVCN